MRRLVVLIVRDHCQCITISIMSHASIHDTKLVVFFDLETTGLKPGLDEIVELGAIVDPLSVRQHRHDSLPCEFKSLIRLHKMKEIPAESTAIHGIKTSDITNCDSFSQVYSRFEVWLQRWKLITGHDRVVLIAHNCFDYDAKMFNAACREQIHASFMLPSWIQFGDSLIAMRTGFVGAFKSFALQKLAVAMNIVTSDVDAHRAISDVTVLMRIISQLPRTDKDVDGVVLFYRLIEASAIPKACTIRV